jgi:adenine-specific DNA-methyltransferase
MKSRSASSRLRHTRSGILEQVDSFRLEASRKLEPKTRSEQGQFLTPLPVARLMASFFDDLPDSVRLLDPGAGVGSLTAAFVDEALARRPPPQEIHVTAYEMDPVLCTYLRDTLALCQKACERRHVGFSSRLLQKDFVDVCRDLATGGLFPVHIHTYNCTICRGYNFGSIKCILSCNHL